MRARTASSPRRRSQGLSLVEILVGVVIGLVGVLAIFQTVAIWDRHTQTTSSGGDAQVAGTLGLFNIERDFKQAGHGFSEAPMPVMGCVVNAFDNTGRGAFNFPLRPIDIVDRQVECLRARVALDETEIAVIYLAPLEDRCGTFLPRATPRASAAPPVRSSW